MVDIRPQDLNPAVTPIDADSPIIIDQGLAGVNRTTSNEMVNAVAPVASQSEAEVGADNIKRMTALRVKQSIASEVGVSVASYAQGQLAENAVPKTRSVIAGDNIDGGGTLENNITISLATNVDYGIL